VRTFRAIEKLDLDTFRRLEEIECEKDPLPKGARGDLMDGLIVAVDLLNAYCGTRKYKRRVFLITDGERETQYSKDELRTVVENFNAQDARLNVIALDFCEDLADDDESEDEEGPRKTK